MHGEWNYEPFHNTHEEVRKKSNNKINKYKRTQDIPNLILEPVKITK